jgi:hypothetical protein
MYKCNSKWLYSTNTNSKCGSKSNTTSKLSQTMMIAYVVARASNIALSSTVAGTVFNWTVVTGASAGASAGSGSSIAQQLTNLGTSPITVTYAVTPTFTNAGVTCTGTTQNVSVVVSPNPVLTVTNNAPTICNPASTNIALSSTTSGAVISWTTAAVAGVSRQC